MVTSSSSDCANEEFLVLLNQARGGDTESLGHLLQWYANYLTILATTQLDRRLRRRINPSDLVQETMLAAHRDFAGFRGESQPELLGWLRKILINTLHRSFARHVKAGKRDIRREVSIDQVSSQMEESAGNLASILPGRSPSPSQQLNARERAVELANQLSSLPEHYRDVIVYRVIQGLSFEEISERMDRSSGAVRMLWLRALDQFKLTYENSDDESPSE
ncbi:MAG: sigma-70 family RNA polymerase sigma factor [Rubripirellula sp.]